MKKINKYDFFEPLSDKVNEKQDQQLFEYFELIAEYNKVMNLTGIDDQDGVYLKHFYDSLTILELLGDVKGKSIADLGTGAGFPGVVLAIIFPETKIYLIEPLTKRCNFLEVVVDKLELDNVEILNERAEDIEQKFDFVVSRAVARLNILLELSIPLVKTGGYFIPMKGSQGKDEIEESRKALKTLNSKVEEIQEIKLPQEESERINIKIKKEKDTDKKYPRNFGMIKKKPL
jgi:16S rRNA (guanine527-N7)-methyltransferase